MVRTLLIDQTERVLDPRNDVDYPSLSDNSGFDTLLLAGYVRKNENGDFVPTERVIGSVVTTDTAQLSLFTESGEGN
jgi:hypothetical protein